METTNQERNDRLEELQKERITLMESMQHLVEQQVEASRLLGLNYDEQVRLQEEVDAEVARLAAEVVRLTRALAEKKRLAARDGYVVDGAEQNGAEQNGAEQNGAEQNGAEQNGQTLEDRQIDSTES